jgi:hypothetical protein
MNPNDDQKLVNFLKQNQPIPPPAAIDLEQQIFNAVAPRQRKPLWIVPAAITATLVTAIFGYQALQPTTQTANQNTDIEEFIASSWSDSMQNSQNSEPSTEYMNLVETNKQGENQR